MEIIRKVLKDCYFSYDENIVHEYKRQKKDHDDTHELVIRLQHMDVGIHKTYQPDLLNFTIIFKTGKYDTKEARTLSTDIANFTNIIDIPKLYMNNMKPDKLCYMMKIDSPYTFCVQLNILSNFPRNISDNDLL